MIISNLTRKQRALGTPGLSRDNPVYLVDTFCVDIVNAKRTSPLLCLNATLTSSRTSIIHLV
jgi:hypothetical protein